MSIKTIVVKGTGVRFEAIANAAITPGHLVELMTTGKVRKHATAAGFAEKAFAVEDDLQGNTISDDYSTSGLVQYNIMRPGDEVYAFLKNGENASIGDHLESAGNGELQEQVISSAGIVETPGSALAVAMDALDMSDSSGADPSSNRIRVRIL